MHLKTGANVAIALTFWNWKAARTAGAAVTREARGRTERNCNREQIAPRWKMRLLEFARPTNGCAWVGNWDPRLRTQSWMARLEAPGVVQRRKSFDAGSLLRPRGG